MFVCVFLETRYHVCLGVSGNVLPAHRAVLVARCDVMAAMFSGKYAEARSRVVPIHGVSSDTFLSFLEYLYTDTCCPASVLQAMAVLVCAEMYQVKRLQHLCEVCVCAYLQSMPSRELASTGISIIRLLRRAKCHNADQLYVWLLHFIANNYLIFSHKPDFIELTDEEREHVERLRWPSRGYLQELSEYQQRRRQLRKSRCNLIFRNCQLTKQTQHVVTVLKRSATSVANLGPGYSNLCRGVTVDRLVVTNGHALQLDYVES
ncbi:hypothetical protein ACEWY4_003984 [Coilia grayii]|uniref:BTB domain-containing protein n=1 Tax=Coilia grayii TaxID=363190 RepID=A0ABD1KKE4_9TELE